jgi:hypothetical protein
MAENAMQRVIIDSRSNRLFRGIEIDQNYDQRGGLCQVGSGHIAFTTTPVNPEYLAYWQDLGFSLPEFITAGPFDPRYTLSELIIQKPELQATLKAITHPKQARLEFSYIEATEQALTRLLEIPAYCNFDLSLWLSRKIPFKELCVQLGLPTPRWRFDPNHEVLYEAGKTMLKAGTPVFIKVNDGTGGIGCGGMFKAETLDELTDVLEKIANYHNDLFLVEEVITEKLTEVALHWEISEAGKLLRIGIFEQISTQNSYSGAAYPAQISPATRELIVAQLTDRLVPYLVRHGGKGFFCCDLMIDRQGNPHWVDLNPRKGGILYLWDLLLRLAQLHFPAAEWYFWHEHEIKLRAAKQHAPGFADIAKPLADLLTPREKPFVVITNPGILRFGMMDVVGISTQSREAAREVFTEAKIRLTAAP